MEREGSALRFWPMSGLARIARVLMQQVQQRSPGWHFWQESQRQLELRNNNKNESAWNGTDFGHVEFGATGFVGALVVSVRPRPAGDEVVRFGWWLCYGWMVSGACIHVHRQ